MFGLPAAALAIYHEARSENKKVVAGIMMSAALTSFLTGITEPLEFTFLFGFNKSDSFVSFEYNKSGTFVSFEYTTNFLTIRIFV